MCKRRLNEKGLTLVEVLAGLSISSFVIGLVTSNLIGGINSFKSVNKQISLHDEANYVMTQFVNKIYVATDVEGLDDLNGPNCSPIITIKDRSGVETTLEFEGNNALLNGSTINQPSFILAEGSEFCKDPNSNNTVSIKMILEDNETKEKFQLNNKVSYVKVE